MPVSRAMYINGFNPKSNMGIYMLVFLAVYITKTLNLSETGRVIVNTPVYYLDYKRKIRVYFKLTLRASSFSLLFFIDFSKTGPLNLFLAIFL